MEGGDPQQLGGAGTAAGLKGGPGESSEEACLSRVSGGRREGVLGSPDSAQGRRWMSPLHTRAGRMNSSLPCLSVLLRTPNRQCEAHSHGEATCCPQPIRSLADIIRPHSHGHAEMMMNLGTSVPVRWT